MITTLSGSKLKSQTDNDAYSRINYLYQASCMYKEMVPELSNFFLKEMG